MDDRTFRDVRVHVHACLECGDTAGASSVLTEYREFDFNKAENIRKDAMESYNVEL